MFNSKPVKEQVNKEEADYTMTTNLLTNPNINADDQSVNDKRDLLVQLSQWQQDRSPAMQKLFLKLAGFTINVQENKLEQIEWDKGVVSLYGAQKLVNFIEPLDHNVMLANWEQKMLVITLREAIAHPLRRFILDNHKEMGLRIEHAEYVFWQIMNTVEPTYWRGWNDGERRKDREIIKIQELRNPYFQQKKKSLFGIEA